MFDTHVHFDGLAKNSGIDDVIAAAQAAGVTQMLAVGGAPEANEFAISVACEFQDSIRAAIGYDRNCATSPDACSSDALKQQAAQNAGLIVAIGEIGLDYHYLPETAGAQESLLEEMLALARELALPVIIHSREAEEQTIALLSDHAKNWKGATDRIGVLHCFTGSDSFAMQVLDLGFHISFSGIVTFKKADALRLVAAAIPDNRLLIETDSPYLAPIPHRGKRNEPAFAKYVAKTLATLRNCSLDTVATLTTNNARHLFF